MRRHGSLSERGRADRADDLSGGDVLLRRDGRDALEVGVGGLVAAVVRDDDGGAHQIVVRDGEHRAGAGGEHLRAGIRLDVDAVVRAPVGERFAVSELVHAEGGDGLTAQGRDNEPRRDGRDRLGDPRLLFRDRDLHNGLHRLGRLLRLDLGNVRGDRLRGDGSRDRRLGRIGRCFVSGRGEQHPIARDGECRQSEEQGYV